MVEIKFSLTKTFNHMKKLVLLPLLLLLFLQPAFSQSPEGLSAAQLDKLDKIFEPARKSLLAALKKKDPKKLDEWQSALKALAEIKDYEEREKASEKIHATYFEFFEAGYAAAKIDEKGIQSKVLDVLKNIGYNIKFGQFLTITGLWASPAPPAAPGGGTCQELKCDFSVDDTETQMTGWGLGYGLAQAYENWIDEKCGLTSKSSVMIDGSCEQFAATGENVSIQPNVGKVEVSTKLQRYIFRGDSNPGFNRGYGYASCGLSISGEGQEKIFIFDSAFGYSPFGTPDTYFFFDKTNQFVKTEFTPVSTGGTYEIQVFARTRANCGGNGSGTGECLVVRPEEFKVCQIPK